MPIITDDLRRAALRELAHPVGAYDKIEPDGGHPLSWILKGEKELMRNNRLLARDQDPDMPPRGSTDPEDTPLNARECMTYIQKMLDVLPPDEHGKLIGQLAALIEAAHSNGGVNGDRGFRSGRRSTSDRRSPAQDGAIAAPNTRSFLRRFPDPANIRFGGTGR